MNRVEQEGKRYPAEVRALMEQRGRIEIGSRLLLEQGEQVVYYQETSGREWLASIGPQPQNEESHNAMLQIPDGVNPPYTIRILGYSPLTFVPNEGFMINIDPRESQAELRVRAAGAEGESVLDRERIMTETAFRVLRDGLAISKVFFRESESLKKFDLREIFPGDFKKKNLAKAIEALKVMRSKRPALFHILMPLLASEASSPYLLPLPGRLEERTEFYFLLLLEGLTPAEMGIYGEILLPELADDVVLDYYESLETEAKRLERELAGQVATSGLVSIAAFASISFAVVSLAREALPYLPRVLVGWSAAYGAYTSLRGALRPKEMIKRQKIVMVKTALGNFKGELRRRKLPKG